jgi:hypothetical protein
MFPPQHHLLLFMPDLFIGNESNQMEKLQFPGHQEIWFSKATYAIGQIQKELELGLA